ncbi:unnamed protein product [Penicillium salamii]|nr:unnamed protein product [Penicillium salamii]CAG8203532.1 unnamed protein product [Penicillium salamii]
MTTNNSWDLSLERVPAPLQRKIVERCFLEFLDDGNGFNEPVVFLRFRNPTGQVTLRAPANTRGLKLRLVVVGGLIPGSNQYPGALVAKTYTYIGPHRRCLSQSLELRVRGRKLVKDFLKVASDSHLNACNFVDVGGNPCGARDYI